MTRLVHNAASSRAFIGVPAGSFTLTVAQLDRVTVSGSNSTVTVGDRIYNRSVGATKVKDYQVTAVLTGRAIPGASISYSSSNPAVATVNSAGYVAHVSNGTATITASYAHHDLSTTLTFSTSTGATVDTFTGFVAGSFGKACWDSLTALYTGKSSGLATQAVFSADNPSAETYVRNTGLWTGSLDLTCVPAALQYSGYAHGGVLITPRHIAYPAHWLPFYEQNINFVANDNTVIRRRLMNRQLVSGYPDVVVYVLDADVPSSIKFAKILPSTFTSKLTLNGAKLPMLTVKTYYNAVWGTDNTNAQAGRFAALSTVSTIGNAPSNVLDQEPRSWVQTYPPTTSEFPDRVALTLQSNSGDSGSPSFLVANGEVLWFGSAKYPDRGTFAGAFKTEINAAITALGGGYQLTEFDLSAYPNF